MSGEKTLNVETSSSDDDSDEKPRKIKKYADLQRLKVEKLMKNIEKPIVIPDRPKEKNNMHVPEFIRNVMGSSAGAGSGEFHVYRHLRRKEYARQKYIQQKSEKEMLDEAYQKKLQENLKAAEERTAKKRAKRLKKKEKLKIKKKQPKLDTKKEEKSKKESESGNDDSSDNENEDKKKDESELSK